MFIPGSNTFHPLSAPASLDPSVRRDMVRRIVSHPIWAQEDDELEFDDCVDVDWLPFVNPLTGGEDTDDAKNMVLAIRIEAGVERTHDVRLDYWAPSLEEAIVELERRVTFFFDDQGVEREDAPRPCWMRCGPYTGGLCDRCGFVFGWWNYWKRIGADRAEIDAPS